MENMEFTEEMIEQTAAPAKEQAKANNAKNWAPSLPSFMQCEEIASKTVSLQLPGAVYDEVARRAAEEGMSISGKATEVVSAAIAQKSMVTYHIYKSGSKLAGVSITKKSRKGGSDK